MSSDSKRYELINESNIMKKNKFLSGVLPIAILTASQTLAQEASAPIAAEMLPPASSGGFFSIVFSSGLLGVITWAAIFFWAIALFPIGIRSVIDSSKLQTKRWPLATKLLLFGPVFLLVLGWFGFVQGLIGFGCAISLGVPDVGVLALCISQTLYSISGTLFLMHFYLLFFLISFIIIHFKQKQMGKD